jgi:nucleoside-diphosphate-sugar epimerase
MRITITGGAGFLGQLVARRLLAASNVTVDGMTAPLQSLTLLDLAAPAADIAADPRVAVGVGDLESLLATTEPADLVIHLAAVVSSAAEADLDLGLRVNLGGTQAVLEACRAWGTTPTVVYSSSLAVFGQDPFFPAPAIVTDDTLPRPQSSYGVQKFIGEQLVADYGRRGLVQARAVRLMTVTVRPGRPNAAASSFVSGMLREPLNGERAICPVDPDTALAVSSLPALVTTPREMAEALDRVSGEDLSRLIDWRPDSGIEAIVGSWPARFDAERARRLGLAPEESVDAIIQAYLEDQRSA